MTTNQWAAPNTTETVMTTELNSIANGAGAITATPVSNDGTGERYPFADFELYLAAQGSARSAGASVELYILPEIDGSNYAYGSASLKPAANLYLGSFLLDAATNARYAFLVGVPLPPQDFHLVIWDSTGQAFAASGNTLKMSRYKSESV